MYTKKERGKQAPTGRSVHRGIFHLTRKTQIRRHFLWSLAVCMLCLFVWLRVRESAGGYIRVKMSGLLVVQERGRPGIGEGAMLRPSGGQQHEAGGPLVVSGVRVRHVEQHRENGAGGVHAQRHPPHQLLVQLLLKVLQHQ